MTRRQICLDTETTGLDFHRGDRLVEIGLVELVDRKLTGRTLHHYLNPQRLVDEAASQVHGLKDGFLLRQPLFGDVADSLLAFIGQDDLIIHNAEFDLNFVNGELALLGRPPLLNRVLDTVEFVKLVEPGRRASLDAAADRWGVDRSDRTLHGALIDAQLLARVYLAMTRHQGRLDFMVADGQHEHRSTLASLPLPASLTVVEPSEDELQAHADYLQGLRKESAGRCIWADSAAPAPRP